MVVCRLVYSKKVNSTSIHAHNLVSHRLGQCKSSTNMSKLSRLVLLLTGPYLPTTIKKEYFANAASWDEKMPH